MNILKILTERRKIGNFGERAAVSHLRRAGYKILGVNHVENDSEIDIIASRYDELHFIEVKTRKFGTMTAPEEAINEQKLRAMRRAVSAYMAQRRCNLEPRFSLIAIEMIGERVESLRFVEDALEFGW